MFSSTLRRICVWWSVASFCLASSAHAGIVYTVRFSDAPATMQAGQTATLHVVLEETISGGDTFRLGSLDGNNDLLGITAANFQVDVSGTGTSSITSALGNATAFDLQGAVSNNPIVVSQTILFNNPAIGTLSGNTRSVLLGTVDILASGLDGQSNTFTLGDPGASDDFVLDSFLGSPDALILDSGTLPANTTFTFVSSTILIAAVPEPASISLVSVAGMTWLGLRRRRRR